MHPYLKGHDLWRMQPLYCELMHGLNIFIDHQNQNALQRRRDFHPTRGADWNHTSDLWKLVPEVSRLRLLNNPCLLLRLGKCHARLWRSGRLKRGKPFLRAVLTTHALHSSLFRRARRSYPELNETGWRRFARGRSRPLQPTDVRDQEFSCQWSQHLWCEQTCAASGI